MGTIRSNAALKHINMSCVITLPNGKDSLLFGSLLQSVGENRAKELYYNYQAKMDKYRSLPKDFNGEPQYEAFVRFVGLDKGKGTSVRNAKELTPLAHHQFQLFLERWSIDPTKLISKYGVFGVPYTLATYKRILAHYQNNPAAEQYDALYYTHSAVHNMLIFGNRSEPEIILDRLAMAAPSINVYSTDNNGYKELSNFFNGPFTINGRTYKTVEHAYQYAKAFRAGDKQAQEKILNATTGADAKSLGLKLRLTPEQLSTWQQENIGMLKMLMKTAFDQNPKNKELLISTGDATLTHYSPAKSSTNKATIWTKEFPRLLMEIRSEYQQTTTNTASQFTNHSGGAIGADSAWDEIGRKLGVTNQRHYFLGTPGPGNAPLGNVDLNNDIEFKKEAAMKAAQAAAATFGYQYATMKDDRLLRNWAQVKYADAVFAIGSIAKMGDPLFPRIPGDTRLARKPAVTGGTGYAVEMAIQAGKPVFVYDQANKSWYTWNGTDFIKTETPTLTANFAGIGTRQVNEDGRRAIEEVYTKSLGMPTPSQSKTLKGKMTFSYGQNKRPDVKAGTTIQAIIDGQRTATTRYESDGNLDYWKSANVGDIIEFEGANGESVKVKVTKALTKLPEDQSAEEWSKKEGWSVEYFKSKVKPKLSEAWQIEYEVLNSTTQQSKGGVTLTAAPLPGVVAADTALSVEKSKEFLKILQPQILSQAYIENRAMTANAMFSFGLRWARIIPGEWELSKQGANLGVPRPNRVAIKSMGDGTYGYFTTDQNNNSLPPLSDIQPIIDYLSSSLGIDMSEYDAMLGNIYDEKSFIHQHRDITEDQSAEKFPVIVLNLGASGSLVYSNDPVKPYNGFTVDGELPLKNGSAYAFGVEGKNRFTFHHRIASGLTSANPLPSIQIPTWDKYGNRIGTKVLDNYRITLTFRRAAPTANTNGPKLEADSVLKAQSNNKDVNQPTPSIVGTAITKNTDGTKTYRGKIQSLAAHQVFVFGANDRGLHGAGAAGQAMFGKSVSQKVVEQLQPGEKGLWTVIGQHSTITEGRAGKSYPMITVTGKLGGKREGNRLDTETLLQNIAKMYQTAMANPDKEFLVAYSGWSPDKKSLNGYTPRELASLFDFGGAIPENIVFEEEFSGLIKNTARRLVVSGDYQFEQQGNRETVKMNAERLREQQLLTSAPILDADGKEIGFFSAEQMNSISGMVKRKMLEYITEGRNPKNLDQLILEDFKQVHQNMQKRIDANSDSLKIFGGVEKALELNNNLLTVIHSFKGVYKKIAKDLLTLYKIDFKRIKESRAVSARKEDEVMVDNDGNVMENEETMASDENSDREVFGKLSEMIDPRDTMTGRVKLMLSTIKKSEYGPEDPLVDKKIPISSNELRRMIITTATSDTPIILPRSAEQAKEIKILPNTNPKLKQGRVVLSYDQKNADGTIEKIEKDFRVTADGYMTQEEADAFNDSYLGSLQKDKEGNQILAMKGDVKYKIEPFKLNESVLRDKIGWAGQPEVADMEEAFEAALQAVHQINPSAKDIIEALKTAGKSNAVLYRLAETLEKVPLHFRNEFITVVRKQNQSFKTVWLTLTKKKNSPITLQARTIDSNRGSAQRILIEGWKESQKLSPIAMPTYSGDYIVNAQTVAALREEMKALRQEYLDTPIAKEEDLQPLMTKAKEFVRKVLLSNGIVFSDEMINNLVTEVNELSKNKERLTGANIFDHMRYSTDGTTPLGLLSVMLSRSGDIETLEDEEGQQPPISKGNFLYTDKDVTSILTNVYIKFAGTISTQSFKNVNGDTVYSFGHPTFLSDEFNKIKDREYRNTLSQSPFIKNNFLFRTLDRGDSIFLEYVDGFAVSGKREGTDRPSMSPREQEIDFVNRVLRTESKGDFYSLTHSDKTRTPLITNLTRVRAIAGNSFTGDIRAEFVYLFMAEYKRIVAAYSKEGTYGHAKYEQGNKNFYMTPFNYNSLKSAAQNGTITDTELALFYTIDGKHSDLFKSGIATTAMQTAVVKVLDKYMESLVQSQLSHWNSIGFIEDGLPLVNKGFISKMTWGRNLQPVRDKRDNITGYVAKNTEGEIIQEVDKDEVHTMLTREMAGEVALNSYIVNASMMQAMYGDPAQFFKGDIDKTLVEYQKRLAGVIAPHRAMAIGSEETYKAITITDLEVGLKVVANKAYEKGINVADAQEWITMREWLYTNLQEGQITEKEYTTAIGIIENSTDGNYTFDKALENKIYGISKPVYYGNTDVVNGDAVFKNYIKSSAIPLYPPLVAGFELNKLRLWMEKNDVRRAHMESAKKAGPGTKATIFNEDGTVNTSAIKSSDIQTYNRRYLGIQQDNPFNPDKKAISVVSQENKLIVATLDSNATFNMLSGESMSSTNIRSYKEAIRIEMLNRKMKKLNEELGIDAVNKTIKDPKKAYNTLIKLAKDNGMSPDELTLIKTDDGGNPYIHPFFLPSSKKYESLILSAIKKSLQIKITGKSYVQASAAGITKIVEAGDTNLSKVVWAKDVKTLSFMEKKDGKVSAAQVLVPFNFFSDKKLKIEDYMTDGKIDSAKLPPEVLQMIGARIPNQGHNSMLAIEIVGFLPEEMGDMIIVPNGITKQMGSDFDVDKLYVYQRPYVVTEEGIRAGVITETKELAELTDKELEHEYFDIHWAVLTNPDMYDRILNPLDKPDLADESKQFGKISRAPFLSAVRQLSDYQLQVDAKSLVGLSSLATTFNAVIQNKNLRAGSEIVTAEGEVKQVDNPIIVHDNNGNKIPLVMLSGNATSYYKGQVRTKHDNITTLQSAFLDNAKDPHSGKLNITLATWPAAYAMIQLQTDYKADANGVVQENRAIGISYVARLMTSAVIRQYTERLAAGTDTLSDYNATADDAAVVEIEEALMARIKASNPNITREELLEFADNVIFSEDSLADMAKINYNTKDVEEIKLMYAMLNKFNQFRIVGRKLIELNSLYNQDTNGAGASIITALDKSAKFPKIMQQDHILNTMELMFDKDSGKLTEQGFLYKKVIEDYMKSIETLFPHSTLTQVFNEIRLGSGKDKLSIRQQEEILRSMKAFVFSSDAMGIYPDSLVGERMRLVYDTVEGPSLAKRVMQALTKPWGRNNTFLQRLYTKVSISEPSTVTYRATTQNTVQEISDKAAWTDLLTSEDREARLLGEDLIRYTYVMGGVQDNNSFSKMIPTAFVQSTKIPEFLRSMHSKDNPLAAKVSWPKFIAQYYQHYPEQTVGLSKDVKELNGVTPGAEFSIPNEPSKNTGHLFVKSEEGKKLPEFLHYRDDVNGSYKLYMKTELSETASTYTRIDVLGNSDIYEFNMGTGFLGRSVVPKNRVGTTTDVTVIKPVTQVPIVNKGTQDIRPELVALGFTKKEYNYEESVQLLKAMGTNPNITVGMQRLAGLVTTVMEMAPADAFTGPQDPFLRLAPLTRAIAHYGRSISVSSGEVTSYIEVDNSRTFPTSSEKYTESILHEFMHMQTAILIDSYTDTTDAKRNAAYAKVRANVEKLVPNMKERVMELATMYAEVNNMFIPATLYAQGYTNAEVADIQYGLSNIHEFAVHVMTNPPMAKWLNSLQYKGKTKSFFTQIMDLISSMLTSIGNALTNGKFDKDSYLAASLDRVLKVSLYNQEVNVENGSPKQPSIVEFKAANGKVYSIMLDAEGNVTNVMEIVNGVAKPLADFTDVIVEWKTGTAPAASASKELGKYEIAKGVFMNKEQMEALDGIASVLDMVDKKSGLHEIVLSGAAGTGKTTILTKVLQQYKGNRRIKFIAPSHNARIELTGALKGFGKAMTVQSAVRLRLDETNKVDGKEHYVKNSFARKKLNPGNIIVMDESSMVNDELMAYLYEEIQNDAIIIYTGDYAQLRPVGQNTMAYPFRATNLPRYNLVQNMRSEKADITRVVDGIRANLDAEPNSYSPIDKRLNSKNVQFIRSDEEMLSSFVNNFSARNPRDLFNSVMVAFRNNTVNELNRATRELLFGKNLARLVPGDYIRMNTTTYAIAELSKNIRAADPAQADIVAKLLTSGDIDAEINKNDRMIVVSHDPTLQKKSMLLTSLNGEVITVEVETLEVERRVAPDVNAIITLNPISTDYVTAFEMQTKSTYSGGFVDITNSDTLIARQLVQMGYGRMHYSKYKALITELREQVFTYEYAYAATAHNVQGSGYKHVYIVESDIEAVANSVNPIDAQRALYVGASRARETLTVLHEGRNVNVPYTDSLEMRIVSTNTPSAQGEEDVIISDVFKKVYTGAPNSQGPIDGRQKMLEALLKNLMDIRKQLSQQISDSTREESSMRADRKVRQQKLELDIEKIKSQMNLNNMIKIGKSHLDWAKRAIESPTLHAKDLITAFALVNMWRNSAQMLGELDEYDKQGIDESGFAELSGQAALLHGKITDSTLINQFMKNTGISRDALVNIEDENMVANATRSLNSAKGQLAQTLGKLMTDTARLRDEQVRRDAFELEDLDKKLKDWAKKTGKKPEDAMELIVRKTKHSISLVNEFSPEWYRALYSTRALRDKSIQAILDNPNLGFEKGRMIGEAYNKYWNTLKQAVHIVDIRNLVDFNTGNVKTGAEYDAEVAAIEKAYGQKADAIVQEAIRKYKRYLTDKEEFFLSVDTSVNLRIDSVRSDSTIIDKQAEIDLLEKERMNEKEVWLASNSPIRFLETMEGIVDQRVNRGEKYVIMVPNREVFPQYYDAKFNMVMEDPELKAIYTYVQSKIQHYVSMLPYDDTKNLIPNFFPAVSKGSLRESDTITERIKNAPTDYLNSLSASPAQEAYRNSSGFEFLPVNYMRASEENVSEMSTDIVRVLEAFGNMAVHFKHFSHVKEIYEIGETILNQHNARVLAGMSDSKSIVNLLQSVQYAKESIMYRRAKDLQGNTGLRIYDTKVSPWNMISWAQSQKVARKQWDSLTKRMDKLNRDRKSGAITEAEYGEQYAALEAQRNILEQNSRTVYGSQIGDKLISIQQAKSLSYNPFSAFANWSFGYVSAINYASGAKGLGDKGDYDSKSFKSAWKMVSSSVGNFFKGADKGQAMKIYRLMELSGVMGDVVDTMYGETQLSTRRDGIPNWAKPYEMMRRGDYNIRASVLIATMMYRKAMVKDLATGEMKRMPIWELYNEQGDFRSDAYEAQGWSEEELADRVEWNKLKNRVNKVIYTVMGNTDKNATKLLKKGILGRLIAQFRLSWMPEGFASRWMDERYDQDLERKTKGRWRDYQDIGLDGSVTILLRMLMQKLGSTSDVFEGITMKNGEDLDVHNMENMYRNFSGIMWTIGVVLAGLMLSYIDLDDDEDGNKKSALKVLINTLYRLQQDLQFYSSTDVLSTVTGNSIPALRVITDYKNAIQATWKAIEEDDYTWDQAMLKWTKAGFPIPQAALINKVKFMTEKELSTISR